MSKPYALIVASGGVVHSSVRSALKELGIAHVACRSVGKAESILFFRPICMVFTDYQLPDGDFRAVLNAARLSAGEVPVFVISPVWKWQECVAALRCGAFEYEDFDCPQTEWERSIARSMSAVSFSLIFKSTVQALQAREGGDKWQTKQWTYSW